MKNIYSALLNRTSRVAAFPMVHATSGGKSLLLFLLKTLLSYWMTN